MAKTASVVLTTNENETSSTEEQVITTPESVETTETIVEVVATTPRVKMVKVTCHEEGFVSAGDFTLRVYPGEKYTIPEDAASSLFTQGKVSYQ